MSLEQRVAISAFRTAYVPSSLARCFLMASGSRVRLSAFLLAKACSHRHRSKSGLRLGPAAICSKPREQRLPPPCRTKPANGSGLTESASGFAASPAEIMTELLDFNAGKGTVRTDSAALRVLIRSFTFLQPFLRWTVFLNNRLKPHIECPIHTELVDGRSLAAVRAEQTLLKSKYIVFAASGLMAWKKGCGR